MTKVTGIARIVSKHDNGYAAVAFAQVCILFPFRQVLEQVPGDFVRYTPIFAGDAGPKCAVARAGEQVTLQFRAQRASDAAGAVTVNQFDCCVALFAGELQFMLHAQTSLLHVRHAFFEVDNFDERGLA